jgi:hypothetical protein
LLLDHRHPANQSLSSIGVVAIANAAVWIPAKAGIPAKGHPRQQGPYIEKGPPEAGLFLHLA